MSNAMNMGVIVLKKLSSDPVVANGAMYFNTTLNKTRICEDGVWKSVVSGIDVVDSIDTEVTARMAADAELKLMIEKEVTDRTSADTAIQSSITSLQTALADETTARTNAYTAIQTKNTEQDTAISSLQDGVANVQSNLDTAVTQLTAKDTQIANDLSTLTSDVGTLSARHDTELETERQARLAADDLKMDKAGGAFSGPVDMSGFELNNLPAATQGNQPATYAQLNTSVQALVNSIYARQSCKCFTNDSRLIDGVDLSSILPFSDDESPTTITISDLVVGDYILAGVTPKLFKVVDDNGTKRATTVGVDQPAEGLSYFVAWDLVNTPAELENCSVQAVVNNKLIKIADVNFQYATGINLSATYAKAAAKSSIQATDSIETAISKLEKNLEVAKDEAIAHADEIVNAAIADYNSKFDLTASAQELFDETAARISEDAKKLNKAGDTMTGDLNMGENKITNVTVIEGKKTTTGSSPVNGMQVTVGSFCFADGTCYYGSPLVFTYRNDLRFGQKVFSYVGPNGWDTFHAAFPAANDFSTDRGLLYICDIDGNKVCEVTYTGSNYIVAAWMSQDNAMNNIEGYGAYGSNFLMVDTLSTVESPVAFSTGIDAGGKVVKNVGPAISDTDAINKAQLTSAINSVSDGAGASVAQEVSDRIAADAILQTQVDALKLATGSKLSSAFTTVSSKTQLSTPSLTGPLMSDVSDPGYIGFSIGDGTYGISQEVYDTLTVGDEIYLETNKAGITLKILTKELGSDMMMGSNFFKFITSPGMSTASDTIDFQFRAFTATKFYHLVGAQGDVAIGDTVELAIEKLVVKDTATTAALAEEVNARSAADVALTNAASAEHAARIAEEARIEAKVNQEVLDRQAAIASLQSDSSDTSAALTQEIADRIAADTALKSELQTDYNAKFDLTASAQELFDEVAARTAADTLIRTDFDTKVNTKVAELNTEDQRLDSEVKRLDSVANKTIAPVTLAVSASLVSIPELSFTSTQSLAKSIKYLLTDTVTGSTRFGTLMIALGSGSEIGQFDSYVSSNSSMDDIELLAINTNGSCEVQYSGTVNSCVLKIMAIVIAA